MSRASQSRYSNGNGSPRTSRYSNENDEEKTESKEASSSRGASSRGGSSSRGSSRGSSARKSGGRGQADGEKAEWVTVGSILERSQKDGGGLYFKATDLSKVNKGRRLELLVEDVDTGEQFKVNFANIYEPHENAPDYVAYNLVLNLSNEGAVEPLGE